MITQQVVTYIKDQLARGTDRAKIRANLLSAGWVESDITQAFSFAEPASPSAAVKIAPAFAVERETKPLDPVDKTKIEPDFVMPTLQKDNVVKEPSNLSSFAYAAPVDSKPIETKPVEPVSLNNIVKTPLSNPVSNSLASQTISSGASNAAFAKPMNTIETDVVRNIEPEPAKLVSSPKQKASPVLKFIAILLFFVLVIGNVYIWMFSNSNIAKDVSNPENNNIQNSLGNQQISNETSLPVENIVNSVNTNNIVPGDFSLPANKIQSLAATYFSKYNSYGGVNMPLGSCAVNGTLFGDSDVKNAINEIANFTSRMPQCALSGESMTNGTNRTTAYMVYVPMEDGGYCADSTGAVIVVSKTPTGTSCATGL